MPADLTSYLASRYLVADTKPTRKRKRKHNKDGSDGLLITDDDDSGWTTKGNGRSGDDDDDNTNVVGAGGGYGAGGTIAGTSAEFRKTKKSNWTVLDSAGGNSTGTGTGTGTPNATENDADAIIAAAAADTAAALAAEDEAPVVEAEASVNTKSAVLMSDGTHAGLQSAASVTAQLERRRREEREQYERERQEKRERRRKRGQDEESGEEEVVYRDATGRRVDVALRRQEVRQAALEAKQKERDAKDALRGDVQREQARQRREELADAALMPLARGADDEVMNRELKAQARWNDPMAAFLTEKTPAAASGGGGASGSASKSGPAKSSRPVYRGPAAPNRYGIRPGYRWDGVDRGIGFETERFKAINRRERNRDLDYQWQMDV
jgi:pre-mRNA-splicing factor CWC26